MVELAVLGVLREGELHGYELRKRVRELLGPGSSVSFGSLYPALARLERDGAVRAVEPEEAAAPMPMTGSLTGELAAFRARRRAHTPRSARTRKVFALTDAGGTRLGSLLAEPAEDDDRAFGLKLALCRWCDPATRLAIFERRRAALAERLAAARRSAPSRAGALDRYRRSLFEREAEVTERDLAWLDGLIAAERESVDPPQPQTTGGPTA